MLATHETFQGIRKSFFVAVVLCVNGWCLQVSAENTCTQQEVNDLVARANRLNGLSGRTLTEADRASFFVELGQTTQSLIALQNRISPASTPTQAPATGTPAAPPTGPNPPVPASTPAPSASTTTPPAPTPGAPSTPTPAALTADQCRLALIPVQDALNRARTNALAVLNGKAPNKDPNKNPNQDPNKKGQDNNVLAQQNPLNNQQPTQQQPAAGGGTPTQTAKNDSNKSDTPTSESTPATALASADLSSLLASFTEFAGADLTSVGQVQTAVLNFALSNNVTDIRGFVTAAFEGLGYRADSPEARATINQISAERTAVATAQTSSAGGRAMRPTARSGRAMNNLFNGLAAVDRDDASGEQTGRSFRSGRGRAILGGSTSGSRFRLASEEEVSKRQVFQSQFSSSSAGEPAARRFGGGSRSSLGSGGHRQ